MRRGHASIITPEERQKILCQIAPISISQGADNAKVHAHILANVVSVSSHRNVARMHVGVKKTIAEHLREKYFNAVAGQLFNVDASVAQLVDLVDWRGVQSLHHHHVLLAPVPVHFGHVEQRRAGEIAAQL